LGIQLVHGTLQTTRNSLFYVFDIHFENLDPLLAWTQFARTDNPGWNNFQNDTKIMMEFNTPNDSLRSAADPQVQARLNLWKQLNGVIKN